MDQGVPGHTKTRGGTVQTTCPIKPEPPKLRVGRLYRLDNFPDYMSLLCVKLRTRTALCASASAAVCA